MSTNLEDSGMARDMVKIKLIITIPKKEDMKKFEHYRIISRICYASKILLIIIINRMNQQAEKILAEEQAGFRKKINTR